MLLKISAIFFVCTGSSFPVAPRILTDGQTLDHGVHRCRGLEGECGREGDEHDRFHGQHRFPDRLGHPARAEIDLWRSRRRPTAVGSHLYRHSPLAAVAINPSGEPCGGCSRWRTCSVLRPLGQGMTIPHIRCAMCRSRGGCRRARLTMSR